MKQNFFIFLYGILVLTGLVYIWQLGSAPERTSPPADNSNISPALLHPEPAPPPGNENRNLAPEKARIWPLAQGEQRTRMITYGLHVTPQTSPLPLPEKWVGYHTGLDLEILPGEEDTPVPVLAICDGTILFADTVNGYGHALIQSCTIEQEEVAVLYGHLAALQFKKGDMVTTGDQIARLGQAFTAENGNVRKHLHFSIHRGKKMEYRGYVQKKEELDSFLDPAAVVFTR